MSRGESVYSFTDFSPDVFAFIFKTFGPTLAFTQATMGTKKVILTIVSVLFFHQATQAQVFQLLPEGVWSPMLRTGKMTNLNLQFGTKGGLETLKSDVSVELDSKMLVKVAPEAQKAIDYLNSTGNNALGDQLHLGVLELDIVPEVNYYAPILAYGVSEKLTIGVGLPMINYKNNVGISHYGSNVGQFQQKFSDVNPELDDAFTRMNAVGTEFQNSIVEKGYAPLSNRDESFQGDMLAVIQYIPWQKGKYGIMTRSTISLPTGPKHNPDDLLAVNLFHRTSLEQEVLFGYQVNRKLSIVGSTGLLFTMPDKITERIPTNEDDVLLDASTKEEVNRQIGMTGSIGVSPRYSYSKSVSFNGGVQYSVKDKDFYSGSQGGRYDLLAKDTESDSTVVNLGLSYSSVDAFQNKKAKLPAIVSYNISETVAGKNTRKTQTHEFLLTLFYK